MLIINDEKYRVNRVEINNHNLTYNGKFIDDIYKIKFIVNDELWVKIYNIKSLDFFNYFKSNEKNKINECVDENCIEICYKGMRVEEMLYDNEIYLNKIRDNVFEIDIKMDVFTFDYHNIKKLRLKSIIDYNNVMKN